MSVSSDDLALRNVRVLVLDDDEPVRRLVETLLNKAGCRVETASDGREGLRILLQRDFDVALVDLHMADMGGSAFLEEARSIWPWLGIVILTGGAGDDEVKHAKRFGVTRILAKPIDRTLLLRNVHEEAKEKRERVEMSATHSLDRIQDQLSILRRFSEIAFAAESLDEAMTNLSTGLSNLIPCSAVGIHHVEQDKHRIFITPIQKVSEQFLGEVESSMLTRYEALTGNPRPTDAVRVLLENPSEDPKADKTLGSSFTIPFIADGAVVGLLTLASPHQDFFTRQDTSFLYHAAHHLSTVLMALSRMRDLSVRDPLTGLYNRKGLEEEYQRSWLFSRRYNYPIAIAVLDIDHFKTLNDSYGHPVGDEILREFSKLIVNVARTTDIVGRYGGDEMVVILQQAGPIDAITFGERLLTAVRQNIFLAKTRALKLTTSIGVASSSQAIDLQSSHDLLAHADQALYQAKRQGRDRVCIFSPDDEGPELAPGARASDAPSSTAPGTPPENRRTRSRGRILVVDDEETVATVIAKMLQMKNYEVAVDYSGTAAMERLRAAPRSFDILLTDLSMPDISGLDLLDQLRSIDDALVKIMITGHATLDNALASLRRGAYDFIEKPVTANHLHAVVERALEYGRLKEENRRYQNHLEEMVRDKSAALRQALDEIKHAYDFTLEALVAMLDARETNTGQHSIRVRKLAIILCKAMGLSESEIDIIARGSLLHDIGKIAIPDAILLKEGPLTEGERLVMRSHPDVGYRILTSSKYLEGPSEIVRSHQESWDGSGYPRGLKGNEICLGARIFAVVDTYDAMRSNRPYRKALSAHHAIEEIKRFADKQFDPAVVEAFLRCQPDFEKVGGWDHGA